MGNASIIQGQYIQIKSNVIKRHGCINNITFMP